MSDATVTLEQLAARLRHLEDLEAVRATWLDYCNRLDQEDFDALADVFTADARLEVAGLSPAVDGTYRGRDPIARDFYARTGTPTDGTPAGAMTGHLSTNMQIELRGDEATTLAYFFEIVDDDLVLIGTYRHRMRREVDRWRIAVLHITVRYRARIKADKVRGRSLREVLDRPL